MLVSILTILCGICIIGAILLQAFTRSKIKTLIKCEKEVPKKLIILSNTGYILLFLALIIAFSLRYV